MLPDILSLLILASIGSIAGLIGGVIFIVHKPWSQTLCSYAVPFAAGVLLTVSLIQILPEAVEISGDSAYLYLLIALLGSFFFEQFFASLHHHDDNPSKASVPLVLFGDTIHNFIDGLAIGAAFLADFNLGLIVALSTFLHETPHEIGDFGVLLSAGWSSTKAFIANFLSALATIPGALLALTLSNQHQSSLGVFLAISAGVFLYLGASDFLPQLSHKTNSKENSKKFLVLLAGVLVILLVNQFVPEHSHS